MSTGYSCVFVETKGRWYYILQRWDCPVGAFDWMEYADCFGPFTDHKAGYVHLRGNHANPGGSMEERFGDKTLPEGVLKRLLEGATC